MTWHDDPSDHDLATAISQTIPPEGALAARVALLEREVLTMSGRQIEAYQFDRDRRFDEHEATTQAISGIRGRIDTLERRIAELRGQVRDYRLLTIIGGLLLAAAVIALAVLR